MKIPPKKPLEGNEMFNKKLKAENKRLENQRNLQVSENEKLRSLLAGADESYERRFAGFCNIIGHDSKNISHENFEQILTYFALLANADYLHHKKDSIAIHTGRSPTEVELKAKLNASLRREEQLQTALDEVRRLYNEREEQLVASKKEGEISSE